MPLDISWLDINQHVYAWNLLKDDQTRIETGLLALQLMAKYQVTNPLAEKIIMYLNSQGVEHPYNASWYENIENVNSVTIQNLENLIDSAQDLNKTPQPMPSDNQALWSQVEKGVVISMIGGSYTQALGFLTAYSQIVQFPTQLSGVEQLETNKYIEYLFYQFVTNTYSLIYFPEEYVLTGSYKNLEAIMKKLSYYYHKNEIIMVQNPDAQELKYYWLIKFYYLTILFKQFKLEEFLGEFLKILKNPHFMWLIQSNANILSLFQISVTFIKPFNQLGLLDFDDDLLIDEINYHQFPKFIYNNILYPLLNSQFATVQRTFGSPVFANHFQAKLGYYLPVSINKSSFLDYFHLIIDFKMFLLILSNTKLIPRVKMLAILGYKNPGESTLSNDLLILLSALNLGSANIGYDYKNDYFYNYEKDLQRDNLQLKISVDNLTVELQGESIAHLVKGALMEKFMGQ